MVLLANAAAGVRSCCTGKSHYHPMRWKDSEQNSTEMEPRTGRKTRSFAPSQGPSCCLGALLCPWCIALILLCGFCSVEKHYCGNSKSAGSEIIVRCIKCNVLYTKFHIASVSAYITNVPSSSCRGRRWCMCCSLWWSDETSDVLCCCVSLPSTGQNLIFQEVQYMAPGNLIRILH